MQQPHPTITSIGMRTPLLLAALFLALAMPLLAQEPKPFPRTMYITFDHTPAYDSASYLANIVGDLRRGDSVRVVAMNQKFYCIVMGGKEAYVLVTNIGDEIPSSRRATASRPSDAPARKPRATSAGSNDGKSAGSSTRAATSVQCRAMTKSGKQCSRMTNDPSGYCWQHKK